MTTWTDLHAAHPDFAARARSILTATTNAVLGTLRADGAPRLSGIDPFFLHDELWIGSMPDARKGADLRRDPRCALHAIPWESRKRREGADDPGDADVKIAARAHLLADPAEEEQILAWFREERGVDTPGGADLFRIELDAVTVTSVDLEANELVIEHWSSEGGLRTTRRE